jgi:hypothetical protein
LRLLASVSESVARDFSDGPIRVPSHGARFDGAGDGAEAPGGWKPWAQRACLPRDCHGAAA